MIKSPLEIKNGTKSTKICPRCGSKVPVEWAVIDEKKLPKFLLEKKKKMMENPEKIGFNLDSALCIGYWKGECNCEKQKPIDFKQYFIGVPRRFEDVDWKKIKICSENKRAVEAARNWSSVDKPRPFGLYFFSEEAGTGKTTIAVACGKTVAERGRTVLFLRAASIPDLTEEAYNNAKEIPVLIIDDVDKIRNTDFGIEKLFELVDYRHSELLSTIVTSNLTPSGIAERYGSSLASRLCDKSSFGVFEVGGSDRRLE